MILKEYYYNKQTKTTSKLPSKIKHRPAHKDTSALLRHFTMDVWECHWLHGVVSNCFKIKTVKFRAMKFKTILAYYNKQTNKTTSKLKHKPAHKDTSALSAALCNGCLGVPLPSWCCLKTLILKGDIQNV